MSSVVSIGYERRTVEELVSILAEHGVCKVIDVREAPISRKPGFSKRALASHLSEAGIEYLHIKEAGNPHRKMKVNVEKCLQLYRGHLSSHPDIVDAVGTQFGKVPTAFLCYERQHTRCHRSVLLEELFQKGYLTEIVKLE